MTYIITSENELSRVAAPNLPLAPQQYSQQYVDQYSNVLRLYFNQLDKIMRQLMANTSTLPVSIGGTNVDAFGRVRISNPFTLFDSQNRYEKDNQFSESLAGAATTTYVGNESSVDMNVTTASGDKAIRQTYRVFPYQPGKGLEVMCTFVMNAGKTNLRQRVGYFNADNGVFFQVNGTTNSFVLRTNTSGTPSDARTVDQADWNGDKLDGTGDSGITLDVTKAQILYMDFEWLGVGSVRCGFVINGQIIICHTFNNANDIDKVYMTTAILPIRYEIENTGLAASGSTLTQICSTVITDGGYQQVATSQYARQTTAVAGFSTTFVPLVSIRLASDSLGAVVLPQSIQAYPTATQDYEVALVKNTTLTAASWDTTTFTHVDYDVSATAMTGGTIVLQSFIGATNQSKGAATTPSGYNFDLQLGVSLAGVSDIYTLAIRTLGGAPTGTAYGAIDFIDLTD